MAGAGLLVADGRVTDGRCGPRATAVGAAGPAALGAACRVAGSHRKGPIAPGSARHHNPPLGGQALASLPAAIRHPGADQGRGRLLATPRRHPDQGRAALPGARFPHRRHHRHRDLLRSPDGSPFRARQPLHPGVPLPRARGVLRQGVRPAGAACPGGEVATHLSQGLLCRRHGHGPVHALQLSPLRRRF